LVFESSLLKKCIYFAIYKSFSSMVVGGGWREGCTPQLFWFLTKIISNTNKMFININFFFIKTLFWYLWGENCWPVTLHALIYYSRVWRVFLSPSALQPQTLCFHSSARVKMWKNSGFCLLYTLKRNESTV